MRILVFSSVTFKTSTKNYYFFLKCFLAYNFNYFFTSFFKDKSHTEVTKQKESMFFLLILLDDRRNRTGTGRPKNIWILRIRIRNTAGEGWILRGPSSSFFWLPQNLSDHMDRQARTGDTVLVKSREMIGRSKTLPWWSGGGGGGDEERLRRQNAKYIGPVGCESETFAPTFRVIKSGYGSRSFFRIQGTKFVPTRGKISILI